MTLVVLALDGVDAGLVEEFDIDAFRLDSHGEIETFEYGETGPYTLELWPTVATGLHPRDHGITGSNISQWDNPVFELGSKITAYLDGSVRTTLGHFVRDRFGSDYDIPETDKPTIFDDEGRVVHNWPGVVNSHELREVWRMTNQGYSQAELEREILGKAASQFGWVREMLNHNVSLAAVHVHAADIFGHTYCEAPDDLRRTYERVAAFVNEVRESLGEDDELLLISDHGVRNVVLDTEENAGSHSYRAFASSTFETIPSGMRDAAEWIDAHVEDVQVDDEELDMPKDQLRQLGYIE